MSNGFQERLISPAARRAGDDLTLDIRLPWYRSLPLSTVEIARLEIDGRPVAASDISLEIDGRRYPVNALGDLVDVWWYVLDSGLLHVRVHGLEGAQHDVDLTVNLYPPYIPGLTWVTQSRRTLRAA